jgi:gluconokinase
MQLHGRRCISQRRQQGKDAPGYATDEDRWPWLQAIRTAIEDRQRAGSTAVFTCSSLKRSYRDALSCGNPDIRFVYLKGSPDVLRARLNDRRGHFFDPALLENQLDTLEEPASHEAVTISIELTPDQIVDHVLRNIGSLPRSTAI